MGRKQALHVSARSILVDDLLHLTQENTLYTKSTARRETSQKGLVHDVGRQTTSRLIAPSKKPYVGTV